MSLTKISDFPKLTNILGNLYIPIILDNGDGIFTNYIIKANGLVSLYESFDADDYYTKDLITSLISQTLTYTATVYKHSEDSPTISGGSYNFVSGELTAPNGWITDVTKLEAPIWVSTKIFYSNGNTSDWSVPTRIIQSSLEILDLVPTIYSALVTLYKSSTTLPNAPVTGEYDFADINGVFNGLKEVPTGWSLTTTDLSNPIWVTYCSFTSDGKSTGWTTPVKLVDIDGFLDDAKTTAAELSALALSNAKKDIASTKSILSSLITDALTSIASATKELASVKTLLENTTGVSSTITLDIDDIKGELETKAQTINALNKSVSTVTSKISSMEASITNSVNYVDAMKDTVNDVSTKLDGINSTISAQASSIDVLGLTQNEVSAVLDGMNANIALCAKSTDVSSAIATAKQSVLDIASNKITESVSSAKTDLEGKITEVKRSIIEVNEDSIVARVEEEVNNGLDTKVSEIIQTSDEISATIADEIDGKVTSASIVEKITSDANGTLSSSILLSADNIVLNGLTIVDLLATKDLNVDNLTYIYGKDSLDNGGTTLMTIGAGTEGMTTFNRDGSGSIAGNLISWTKDPETSKFELSVEGNINALSGTIGGWTIGADYLYVEDASSNKKMQLHPTYGIQSVNSDNTLNWSLASDGTGSFAGGNLSWDNKGDLYIKGSITATSGKIGNWLITDDGITTISNTATNAKTTADEAKATAETAKSTADGATNAAVEAAKTWLTSDTTATTNIGKNFVYTGTIAANNLILGSSNDLNLSKYLIFDSDTGKISLGSDVVLTWNTDWDTKVDTSTIEGRISTLENAGYTTENAALTAALNWLTSDTTSATTIGKNFVYTGTVAASNLVLGAVGTDSKCLDKYITFDSTTGKVTLGSDIVISWNDSWNSNVSQAAGTYDDSSLKARLDTLEKAGYLTSSDLAEYAKTADLSNYATSTVITDWLSGNPSLTTYVDASTIVTSTSIANSVFAGKVNAESLLINSNGKPVFIIKDNKATFAEDVTLTWNTDWDTKVDTSALSTRISTLENAGYTTASAALTAALNWLTSDSTSTTNIGKNFVYTGTIAANNLILGKVSDEDKNLSNYITFDSSTGKITLGSNVILSWDDSWNSKVSLAAGTYDDSGIKSRLDTLEKAGYITSSDLAEYAKTADLSNYATSTVITDWLNTNPSLTTYVDANSIVTSTSIANSVFAGKINAESLLVNSKGSPVFVVNGDSVSFGSNVTLSWGNLSGDPKSDIESYASTASTAATNASSSASAASSSASSASTSATNAGKSATSASSSASSASSSASSASTYATNASSSASSASSSASSASTSATNASKSADAAASSATAAANSAKEASTIAQSTVNTYLDANLATKVSEALPSNVMLTTTKITKNLIETGVIGADMIAAGTLASNVIYAGTITADLLKVGGSGSNKGDALFSVDSSGNVTAESLSVKKINNHDVTSMFTAANVIGGGTIGGWTATTNSLYNVDYTYTYYDDYDKYSFDHVATSEELIAEFEYDITTANITYTESYEGMILNKDFFRLLSVVDGKDHEAGGKGYWIDINKKGIAGYLSSTNVPNYSSPEDTKFKFDITGSGFVASNNFSWDEEGNIFGPQIATSISNDPVYAWYFKKDGSITLVNNLENTNSLVIADYYSYVGSYSSSTDFKSSTLTCNKLSLTHGSSNKGSGSVILSSSGGIEINYTLGLNLGTNSVLTITNGSVTTTYGLEFIGTAEEWENTNLDNYTKAYII